MSCASAAWLGFGFGLGLGLGLGIGLGLGLGIGLALGLALLSLTLTLALTLTLRFRCASTCRLPTTMPSCTCPRCRRAERHKTAEDMRSRSSCCTW